LTSPRPSERVLALRLLRGWVKTGRPPDEDSSWADATPLARELVLTTLRNKRLLDAVIHHLSARAPGADFRPVLWIGLTQLLLLDGIAEHAAVHETLEAAHKARFPKPLTGYANGLLRNVIRRREEITAWIAQQPPAVRLSHPDILFRRWSDTFGPETAEAICRWNQQRASTFARLRTGDIHVGPDIAPTDFPNFFLLPRGLSPTDLPGFAEGHWYIQDPSTALAPALMRAAPGERILDACAAPGGKTAILAEALGDGGAGLTALDPNPARIERLRQNLQRLRLDGVHIQCGEMKPLNGKTFDGILLDVPCSNTGVLQRRVDARWRFTRRALTEVTALQAQLLNDAASLTAPGSRIVYSTCSIEPEETTQQIRTWLETRPGWRLDEEILRLPGEQNTDGAYAARLTLTAG
jgi:16S rRNA (cytosine967-C5)-methyltransferase